MSRKKGINNFGFFTVDKRTIEEKVFDLVKVAVVKDMIYVLLADHTSLVNTETNRGIVEEYLQEIYQGRYLVRCSELENPQEIIDNDQMVIRFVGIDEDFDITIELFPSVEELNRAEQLDLNLTDLNYKLSNIIKHKK